MGQMCKIKKLSKKKEKEMSQVKIRQKFIFKSLMHKNFLYDSIQNL